MFGLHAVERERRLRTRRVVHVKKPPRLSRHQSNAASAARSVFRNNRMPRSRWRAWSSRVFPAPCDRAASVNLDGTIERHHHAFNRGKHLLVGIGHVQSLPCVRQTFRPVHFRIERDRIGAIVKPVAREVTDSTMSESILPPSQSPGIDR